MPFPLFVLVSIAIAVAITAAALLSRWRWIAPACVALASLLLFVPSFDAWFAVLDFNVLDMFRRTSPSTYFLRMFDPSEGGRTLIETGELYRPIYFSMLWFEHQLFGLDPLPYYLFNAVLHATNSVLVWLLAWRLTRSQPASTIAALVWAFHPAYPDGVAWIVGVIEPAYVFFGLSAVLLYASALEKRGRRRWLRYGGSLAAAVLALGTKESGISVVPIIVAYHLLLGQPELLRRRQVPWLLLPFLLIPVVYFPLRAALVGNLASEEATTQLGWDLFRNIHRMSSLAARPLVGQTGPSLGLGAAEGTVGIVLIAATVAAAMRGSRREWFLVGWYYMAFAPFLILVPFWLVGRYVYLSLVGLAILTGIGSARAIEAIPRGNFVPSARMVAMTALLASVMIWFGWLNRDYQAWLTAKGEEAKSFIAALKATYPTLPEETRLIVTDYPSSLSLYPDDGKSLRPAIWIAYDRDVEVVTLSQLKSGAVPPPLEEDLWYPLGLENLLLTAEDPEGWQAWRSVLQRDADGLLVSSAQPAYGPYARTQEFERSPQQGHTFLALIWVKGTGNAVGDLISISLREDGIRSQETEANGFFELTAHWQPIWVERTVQRSDVAYLSLHVIKFNEEHEEEAFLVRDAQVRLVGE